MSEVAPPGVFMKYLLQSKNKNWKRMVLVGLMGSSIVALKKYSDAQFPRGEKKDKDGKKKATVNKEMFQKFSKFFPVLVPGLWSRESFNLIAIGIVLLCRTWLDFWMIGNNAEVLGAVAKRNKYEFTQTIFKFAAMQLPTSLINNLLKYLISSLALNFRNRLTIFMHKKYMKGITFYSVSNLDNRIKNPDQLLCTDIENFSTSCSNLYSNISKPLVDMVVFYVKLVNGFGFKGPTTMLAYFFLAGALMTKLRSPFGKYTSVQGKLEGDFRHLHSRVITHSEEIAFFSGNEREHSLMNRSFKTLMKHIAKSYSFRLNLGFVDSIVTKYCATILAYFLVCTPIFDAKNDARYKPELGGNVRMIMVDYTRYMRLLVAMVSAVARLVGAGRELSHFAGHVERVSSLNDVLEDLQSGTFKRTMVSENSDNLLKEKKGEVVISEMEHPVIQFDNVPIVTPNGDILVKNLTFKVEGGQNCLITGPNGCGKSSLFRILGGLWPLYDGVVTRPNENNLFYVPQRPYLALGSLRDQIIYPDTAQEAKEKGYTDDKLMELMDVTQLEYVVDREGGWDSVADWLDVLSGGEKQRIAMARLFYHKPQFAILDECTSAVSVDVEGKMYAHCKKVGITLFTVSHRATLWKFHEYLLKFDGQGSYEFKELHEDDYPN